MMGLLQVEPQNLLPRVEAKIRGRHQKLLTFVSNFYEK